MEWIYDGYFRLNALMHTKMLQECLDMTSKFPIVAMFVNFNIQNLPFKVLRNVCDLTPKYINFVYLFAMEH